MASFTTSIIHAPDLPRSGSVDSYVMSQYTSEILWRVNIYQGDVGYIQ